MSDNLPAGSAAAAATPRPGNAWPLGSTIHPDGVNFSVWARSATSVELLLFDATDAPAPSRVVTLDPVTHHTYSYWHVDLPGIRSGQVYGWRVHGSWLPEEGLRHDSGAVLLDPYATAVVQPSDPTLGPRSVVADLSDFDWEEDAPLQRPFARTVVYELHVRGFTAHPSSGLEDRLRGTYAGLVAKIPYLLSLGVTAVELMPVQAHARRSSDSGLPDYWGYNPISFFAVHPGYATAGDPLGVLDEFRTMVKELHRAGIEVILDVVFNHTAEGGAEGRTFCWRGLDNEAYYLLDPTDRATYADYTGCGNTLNANHSVVRRMVVDALHHWVADMHVDGFRFDLASVLSRDSDGHPMANAPVLWQIETDPWLASTKIIAEAWDAGGLYQVGSFVGDRWREWNGRFRDDVRRFVRGDRASVRALRDRLLASPDMYAGRPSEIEHSVNFVTCHDGFTLNDLVSYSHKHNEANLEHNRDGSDAEWSWNGGVEGPTDDPEIERRRNRQVKSLLGITLISMGVPMIAMGDEARRTQLGNNNAYCQDNEVSWFDWSLLDRHHDVVRFTQGLIRLRLNLDMTQAVHGLPLREFLAQSQVEFHGVRLHEPDFGDDSHTLAVTVRSVLGSRMVHAILNMYREPLDFELPAVADGLPWRRFIDTALESPHDISGPETAPVVASRCYRAEPWSVVLLIAALRAGGDIAPSAAPSL
jgi:glycogen operon protein